MLIFGPMKKLCLILFLIKLFLTKLPTKSPKKRLSIVSYLKSCPQRLTTKIAKSKNQIIDYLFMNEKLQSVLY